MKHLQHVTLFFLLNIPVFAQSGAEPIKCVSSPDAEFNSCELFTKRSSTGELIPSNAYRKNETSVGSMLAANLSSLSFTSQLIHNNHPAGHTLFPTNASLASHLNNFLKSVEDMKDASWEERFKQGKDNLFLKYFTQFQLTILYQVYQYLLGIYTTLNMSHANDMIDYLTNERTKALNKKTLIINHLINIMETQLSQAVHMRFPALDKSLASQVGPMLTVNDNGVNLDIMIKGQEKYLFFEPDAQQYVKEQRELYSTIFSKYLIFFHNYTESLFKKDGYEVFRNQAEVIKNVINNAAPKVSSGASLDTIRQIKSLNPPLFFYDDEALRALKLVPILAQHLAPNTASVDWPEKIVENAQSGKPITDKYGNVISTYPRAFFTDKDGNHTTNRAQAISLFINIPTLDNIYSQEVIKQPAWLNNFEGIMQMLSLCLGDYSAAFQNQLAQEVILDPGISYIVLDAMNKAQLLKDKKLLDEAYRTCFTSFIHYLETLGKDIVSAPEPASSAGIDSPPTI